MKITIFNTPWGLTIANENQDALGMTLDQAMKAQVIEVKHLDLDREFNDNQNFLVGGIRINGAEINSLIRTTRLARKFNVELFSRLVVENNQIARVETPDDEKEFIFIHFADGRPVTRNNYDIMNRAGGLMVAYIEALKNPSFFADDVGPRAELSDLIRHKGIVVEVFKGDRHYPFDPWTDSFEMIGGEFILPRWVVVQNLGSLDAFGPDPTKDPTAAQDIFVHNHPNKWSSPLSEADIQFYSGKIGGLILDTPEGERLMFFDLRDKNSEKVQQLLALEKLYWQGVQWQEQKKEYSRSPHEAVVLQQLLELSSPITIASPAMNAKSDQAMTTMKEILGSKILNSVVFWGFGSINNLSQSEAFARGLGVEKFYGIELSKRPKYSGAVESTGGGAKTAIFDNWGQVPQKVDWIDVAYEHGLIGFKPSLNNSAYYAVLVLHEKELNEILKHHIEEYQGNDMQEIKEEIDILRSSPVGFAFEEELVGLGQFNENSPIFKYSKLLSELAASKVDELKEKYYISKKVKWDREIAERIERLSDQGGILTLANCEKVVPRADYLDWIEEYNLKHTGFQLKATVYNQAEIPQDYPVSEWAKYFREKYPDQNYLIVVEKVSDFTETANQSKYSISHPAMRTEVHEIIRVHDQKNTGGIDLTANRMKLEVDSDKASVSTPMNLKMLENIEINGLYIKDIEIKPLTNLPKVLGIQSS